MLLKTDQLSLERSREIELAAIFGLSRVMHKASGSPRLVVFLRLSYAQSPALRFDGCLQVTQLADHIGVTRAALSRIIDGHAGVTAEMDLKLHQALGTREGLWLDLQKQRDLWVAKQAKVPRIKRLVFAEFGVT